MSLRGWANDSRTSCLWLGGLAQVHAVSIQSAASVRAIAATLPALLFLTTTREGIYNILWGLVFAFSTLNILSLGARRTDPSKRGLSFGEVLAILIVLISIVLLGWELLYQFQILPLRFAPE